MIARTLALAAALGVASLAWQPAQAQVHVVSTKTEKVGKGSANAYVTMTNKGVPIALGVSFNKGALDGLPTDMNPTNRCFNGKCLGDYDYDFALQGEAAKAVSPFAWIMLNWNPHGHGQPAPPPWAEPHFDIHFYIADRATIRALKTGTCGEMIDCEDFKRATKPVPGAYTHGDYISVDAAVPAMGNHLIDTKSPELQPGGPKFTATFIFGALDGHVAFYEPMITLAYLRSNPNKCETIKQPAAFEFAGHYPTKYCVRHTARTGKTTVSIEGFVKRTKG
jgi:hypothetical protein